MQCRLFVIIRWHSKYVNMPKFVIIRSDIKQSVSAPKLVTIRFYDKLCLKITIRMHGLRIVTFQSCKPIWTLTLVLDHVCEVHVCEALKPHVLGHVHFVEHLADSGGNDCSSTYAGAWKPWLKLLLALALYRRAVVWAALRGHLRSCTPGAPGGAAA